MNGVYIISDYKAFTKEIIKQLGIPDQQIISRPSFEKENSYHDWVTDIFGKSGITKLLVPLNSSTDDPINDGFKIALHIRLNYELAIAKRIIPIIFLSDFTWDIIFHNNNFDDETNPQNLLFTPGIYFSSFDIAEIKSVALKSETCKEKDYQRQILNRLKIIQKASVGKHSIANAWGCYKLAQVTGLRDEIYKHESISEHLKTLHAKFLICYNDTYKQDKLIDLSPIKCSGKKILFIDDQGDEGWAILMKNIFKFSGDMFLAIDSSKYKNKETKLFHDYEGFLAECRNQVSKDWDLIIIDLRLHPELEDIDNDGIAPTEFSGHLLINEFLNNNEGNQIIVSTASNKIWNINVALKRGIASYYIKESPEFNYTLSETKKHYESFKNEVKKCFEKSYLRTLYSDIQQMKLRLSGTAYPATLTNELNNQLDLAYQMISHATSKLQFAYAFVTLYLFIEVINNYFISRLSDDKWQIISGGNLLNWKWDGSAYSNTNTETTENKPPEWQKFAGIYFQKWLKTDNSFVQTIYFLITKRNGFIHNDRSILDKQDSVGAYLNHDIYEPIGFIKLFNCVKEIVKSL